LIAYQEAEAYFEESIELAKIHQQHWELVRGLEFSGYLALFLGYFERAYARLSEARAISKGLGLPYRTLHIQIHTGVAKWLAGDYALAETDIREAVILTQEMHPPVRIFPTVCLAELLTLTGRYREAQAQMRMLHTLTQGLFVEPFVQGRLDRIAGWPSPRKNMPTPVPCLKKALSTTVALRTTNTSPGRKPDWLLSPFTRKTGTTHINYSPKPCGPRLKFRDSSRSCLPCPL
jgi:hypothetical protein